MHPTERDEKQPPALSVVPMRDLLAACAAAALVSTPPPVPQPGTQAA
ncbi:hypothetical protein SUDANB96_04106 [Streptomyces sp. enrichment culture]